MSSDLKKIPGIVKRTDHLLQVDPREILVRDDFNPRTVFALEDMKASIKDNGFFLDKPILLNRRGTELILVDGERRLRAVLELIAEGVPLLSIPAVFESTQNEGELLARALAANSGQAPLEPFDEARAFKRLKGYGWDAAEIARKVGRSQSHVYGRLALLDASQEVVDAVEEGVIGTSDAIKVVKASQRGVEQSRALKEVVKKKGEKKAKSVRRNRPETHEASLGDDLENLKLILDERGIAWVVRQLLEYADKEEVLDAVADICADVEVA